MPGSTPAAAVAEFLAPFQQAMSCVAHGKITTKRGGTRPKVGDEQQWALNNGAGVAMRRSAAIKQRLPGTLEFFAHMWWKVINDERAGYGPYRVTTTGYDYSLVSDRDGEVWAMHWHVTGISSETKPHIHLGDVMLSDQAPVNSATHLQTGRMTFETAIRWLVAFGVEPLHDDWENRLALAETPHLLFRSWSADPAVRSDGG